MKVALRCLILVSAAAGWSSCSSPGYVRYVDHDHYYHHSYDYGYARPSYSYRATSYRESEPEGFRVVNQYDRDDR